MRIPNDAPVPWEPTQPHESVSGLVGLVEPDRQGDGDDEAGSSASALATMSKLSTVRALSIRRRGRFGAMISRTSMASAKYSRSPSVRSYRMKSSAL